MEPRTGSWPCVLLGCSPGAVHQEAESGSVSLMSRRIAGLTLAAVGVALILLALVGRAYGVSPDVPGVAGVLLFVIGVFAAF